jgi:hypothetical protein
MRVASAVKQVGRLARRLQEYAARDPLEGAGEGEAKLEGKAPAAAAGSASGGARDLTHEDLYKLYAELSVQNERLQREKAALERQADERQRAFVRKEADYQDRLVRLRDQLAQAQAQSADGAAAAAAAAAGGGNDAASGGGGAQTTAKDLRAVRAPASPRQNMDRIREMHRCVQDSLSEIQGKTSQILQEQERNLLRSFRSRLSELTEDLEKERRKNVSGAQEWIAKCEKLARDLEWLQQQNDRLTAENARIAKESRATRRQLKLQEADREFLIRQLVLVKKENARLRETRAEAAIAEDAAEGGAPAIVLSPPSPREVAIRPQSAASFISALASRPQRAMSARVRRPGSSAAGRSTAAVVAPAARRDQRAATATPAPRRPMTAAGARAAPRAASAAAAATTASSEALRLPFDEERYRSVVARLQRQLEGEAAKSKQLRVALNREHASRCELQELFRKCVDEAKRASRDEALRAPVHSESAKDLHGDAAAQPQLSAGARVDAIHRLLLNETVIESLYRALFPLPLSEAALHSHQPQPPAQLTAAARLDGLAHARPPQHHPPRPASALDMLPH